MNITVTTNSVARAGLDLLVLVHGLNAPRTQGLEETVAKEFALFCRDVKAKRTSGPQTLLLTDGPWIEVSI